VASDEAQGKREKEVLEEVDTEEGHHPVKQRNSALNFCAKSREEEDYEGVP
jgi:hypothetical protein